MIFMRIKNWANQNEGFIGLIALIVSILGILLFESSNIVTKLIGIDVSVVFRYIRYIFFITGIISIYLFYRDYLRLKKSITKINEKVNLLENRPTILLNEIESSDLSIWSFGNDMWSSDNDGLSVTRSTFGGICKIGATWENYILSFSFRIIADCAAWIVRAASIDRYIMIQCNDKKQLRPHVRDLMTDNSGKIGNRFVVIKEINLNIDLKEWSDVRTEVNGYGIKVWINDTMVWSDPELLKYFPMGTVGFRCSRNEHALFKSIRVVRK